MFSATSRLGASCLSKQMSQMRVVATSKTAGALIGGKTSPLTRSYCRQWTAPQIGTLKPTSALSSFSASLLDVLPAAQSPGFQLQQCRTKMTHKQKVQSDRDKRRAKIFARKKKNRGNAPQGAQEDAPKAAPQTYLQNEEWAKFQQSISIDGFETGQIVAAQAFQPKTRSNKRAKMVGRQKLGALPERPEIGKFTTMRLSPELTKELLAEAYSHIPERAGKRGTNNLRRQNRRWKLVRDIHAKRKAGVVAAHERRMEHRHERRQRVIRIKEIVPETRELDSSYQASVLKRWAGSSI